MTSVAGISGQDPTSRTVCGARKRLHGGSGGLDELLSVVS
jgi:hypothetical protein